MQHGHLLAGQVPATVNVPMPKEMVTFYHNSYCATQNTSNKNDHGHHTDEVYYFF